MARDNLEQTVQMLVCAVIILLKRLEATGQVDGEDGRRVVPLQGRGVWPEPVILVVREAGKFLRPHDQHAECTEGRSSSLSASLLTFGLFTGLLSPANREMGWIRKVLDMFGSVVGLPSFTVLANARRRTNSNMI